VIQRDQQIIDHVAKIRPDMLPAVKAIVENPYGNQQYQAMHVLMIFGFEAGRQFQTENPNTELNNPNVYL
jgi:hypothetical protein